MTTPRFAQDRDALLARLTTLAQQDDRIRALWLQGSLADGTADPWSDIDAYLAITDDAFDAVYAARHDLLAQLGTPLATYDQPDWRAVNALLDGPVKLDLFFAPVSRIATPVRPAVRVVIDKDNLAPTIRTGDIVTPDAAAQILERTFRGVFQGAAWPIRLLNRGQWTTFASTELQLVNDFLATIIAATLDPALLFKNRISLPRHLPPTERAQIESLGAAIITAVAAHDLPAALTAHLAIVEAFYHHGRRAYTALNLPYPLTPAAETAILHFFRRDWPTTL